MPAVWPVTCRRHSKQSMLVQAKPSCSDIPRSLVFPPGFKYRLTPTGSFLARGSGKVLQRTLKNHEKLGMVLVEQPGGFPMSDLYRFGQFVLDPRKRTLSRAGSPVSLTPKAFDVLLFLAQNPHRLVTKEELLQAVWGDTFVEEGNLTQYISHLRKALGDNAEDARLILPIPRTHY